RREMVCIVACARAESLQNSGDSVCVSRRFNSVFRRAMSKMLPDRFQASASLLQRFAHRA
ncbi:MAG: hypothetical protein SNJ72_10865, partial [Fimbriimonadales bacterium]